MAGFAINMKIIEQFRAAIPGLIRLEAKPVDKYGHQPRLYTLTRKIGEGQIYDDDIVFAAAWLHDLGVFIGHRPENPEQLARWDHVAYTCERLPGILASAEFPAGKIEAVIEVVRTHQPQDEPRTIEAIILRDADILEQLGAIGILRAVAKVGRDTRYSTFSEAVAFLQRNLIDLPPKIRLETTRQLAEPKLRVLRDFLAAVEDESQAALF